MLKIINWKNFNGENHTTTFKLVKNLVGTIQEYWTILIVAQDGKSTQNKWGGFSVRNTGKPVYIQKKWKVIDA